MTTQYDIYGCVCVAVKEPTYKRLPPNKTAAAADKTRALSTAVQTVAAGKAAAAAEMASAGEVFGGQDGCSC